MATLLQTLLIHTLNPTTDSVLHRYIETVLPALEQESGAVLALEETEIIPCLQQGNRSVVEPAQRHLGCLDPSLLVQTLTSLLTAWNLLPYLSSNLVLSDAEKRLLCLGSTLHHYSKWKCDDGDNSPFGLDINKTLEVYRIIGSQLNFDIFWGDWHEYLSEIIYLAQATHYQTEKNAVAANQISFKISKRRLNLPLRSLLEFGAIATQLTDPIDLVTKSEGNSLQNYLRLLKIRRKPIYHRSCDYIGLLTQIIHNGVMRFVKDLDWQPILFFAQGVIYLAPEDSELSNCTKLQPFLWEQVSQGLSTRMLQGKVGFKRDGKGLKAAPQTLELFSPAYLIRNLPQIIQSHVNNAKGPATPKRLEKLDLSPIDRQLLAPGADLRADRLAEFIILVQKEFFKSCPQFIDWMLEALNLQSTTTIPKLIQLQSGGVNLGWYYAAAQYVAQNPTLDCSKDLQELADHLASWAEAKQLLPIHASSTREVFYDYVAQ